MGADTVELANMMYGEAGNLSDDTLMRIGSSALNRLDANKSEEFGGTLTEVLNKSNAYYSVQNQNDPYTWVSTGQFPNKTEENKYKKILGIAYGLQKGTIDRQEGQFFLTPKEVKKAKKNPKILNLKLLREVGSDDTHKYFSY